MNKIKKSTKIQLEKYIHEQTGESILDVLSPGASLVLQEDNNEVKIKYDDYVTINGKSLQILCKLLKPEEIGRIMMMSKDLKTPLNLIYNGSRPHTNKTLQEYINFKSESMFHKFMKKLMHIGLIYQIKGMVFGEIRVIYSMNPKVAKKRMVFDSLMSEIFAELEG